MCKGRGAAQLHVALDRERQSVVDFLTVVTAETLTPLQEAWLDAESSVRPWWPDVFAMCDALALQHGQPAVRPRSCLVDVGLTCQSMGQHGEGARAPGCGAAGMGYEDALSHACGASIGRLHSTAACITAAGCRRKLLQCQVQALTRCKVAAYADGWQCQNFSFLGNLVLAELACGHLPVVLIFHETHRRKIWAILNALNFARCAVLQLPAAQISAEDTAT